MKHVITMFSEKIDPSSTVKNSKVVAVQYTYKATSHISQDLIWKTPPWSPSGVKFP